jgi:serine phosphatase RsbU (regulator of sigma subunit)
MKIPFKDISRNKKLENVIFAAIIIILFRLVFPSNLSSTLSFISELLLFSLVYLSALYLDDFFALKKFTPLSVILNVGVFNAILFFIFSISEETDSNVVATGSSEIKLFFYILSSFLLIGGLTYLFTSFRYLFFLRQKKNPAKYFNVMTVFFILTYFLYFLQNTDRQSSFIWDAFFVVSVVLISINSLRVSWIAFLTKKEKIYLIVMSVIIAILFLFNASYCNRDTITSVVAIRNFSGGLWTFLVLMMLYGAIYSFVIFFTALFHLPTAEAFDRKAEEVSSLMDLSKIITQVFDLKQLSETVISLTSKICNSECAWLVTAEDDEIAIQSVANIGYVEAEKITMKILLEIPEKIEETITLSKSSIRITYQNDLKIYNFSSIAIAPLIQHGQLMGYIFAAKRNNTQFDDEDKKAISTYADYASVAFENAKLFAESIEKERMEKELEVAREIQGKILPEHTPVLKNLQIAARFKPAYEVGGDYYDFFEISNNILGFVVADVSGKGISAAFIMAEVKGVFESLSKTISAPKELLSKANEILKKSLDKKNFVTAVYGTIDLTFGKVNLARAGHTPVILAHNKSIKRLTPNGLGLGIDNGINFNQFISELEIQLNNNDILTLYSDGITECKNSRLEDFGLDRFEQVILENCNSDVEDIADKIIIELEEFSKEYFQHDDITLVLFKWGN